MQTAAASYSKQVCFSSRLVTFVSKCGQLYIHKIETSNNTNNDDILHLKKPIQEAEDIKQLKTTLSIVLRELRSRNISQEEKYISDLKDSISSLLNEFQSIKESLKVSPP